ncbi:hypothetical protein SAMN05428976_1083 [Clostridium sp. USBA 49]|jgi:uncharacterized YccA/Bax inhibitor family protein|uniref:hypothetical protein n=1 Tax=Clostridium TaxID=1485 RepID=UPI00099A5BB9|nr:MULTISPECIES: hypothetical protein [Clostridium]SKA85767.1 hypothetical protein SAMN05428976_1083 [Clostridium sp. USBA 49]
MAFLTLILTCPLVFISKFKKQENEEYYNYKLLGIWFLCQLYITFNNSFRFPFGIILALLVVYKTKFNKTSKFIALILGIMSLFISSIVYLIFSN